MRLGELVSPDREALRDYRKIVRRSSVHLTASSFDFYLPGHKADRLFEGNRVLPEHIDTLDDPYTAFIRYLNSRDTLFPYHAELWLRADGTVPTWGWFMRRLRHHFSTSDIARHSLRSGGGYGGGRHDPPPHPEDRPLGIQHLRALHPQASCPSRRLRRVERMQWVPKPMSTDANDDKCT
ncbi:hypothetical protein K523DRAFT_326079 [Schizophyllum commune Tattone D]|nr:hypothetical protein K523DRAFT_326079 [Schizophyllum commune Tattone D]